MKKLSNFLVEYELKSELPHVYLDMDGVLVDLMKGAFKVHGKELSAVPKPERWDKITQTKDFWKNLEWMPGAAVSYTHLTLPTIYSV